MLVLNCPSCGAEIAFKSRASVFAVCSFCKSTVVRQDMDLSTIGKMADLQFDMTPLQVGTTGYYDGRKFELIGRLKVGYEDGFWNEWYTLFDNEEPWWLAEAQGFYALCSECSPSQLPDQRAIFPGALIDLAPFPGASIDLAPRARFTVEDIKDVRCLFSEGELPINAVQGRASTSVDLTAPGKQMATIEFAADETRVFAGEYRDFDELKFSNLRSIDGW